MVRSKLSPRGDSTISASNTLEPAFVLHSIPYRETSLIVDFLTPTCGRVSCIAKGAKRRNARSHSLLQAFTPLMITWCGRRDLHTLTHIEHQTSYPLLQGIHLLGGLYINELLKRVLAEKDPHPAIFHAYQDTIKHLTQGLPIEEILRPFELILLTEIGYGIPQDIQAPDVHHPHRPHHYQVSTAHGLVPCTQDHPGAYLAKHLYEMAQGNFSDPNTRRDCKRLVRELLQPLLGDTPLHTRDLLKNLLSSHQ